MRCECIDAPGAAPYVIKCHQPSTPRVSREHFGDAFHPVSVACNFTKCNKVQRWYNALPAVRSCNNTSAPYRHVSRALLSRVILRYVGLKEKVLRRGQNFLPWSAACNYRLSNRNIVRKRTNKGRMLCLIGARLCRIVFRNNSHLASRNPVVPFQQCAQ